MRLPGPTEVSLLVGGAGPRPGLRAGAVVSVQVLERLGAELFRVKVGGAVMSARAASLRPGDSFSARVERSGDGFLLRALAARGDSLQSLIARSGLPDDSLSRLALAALLREGAAPEARSLQRVRRAAAPAEGKDEAELEDRRAVAARLEAKGIAAEGAAVDGVCGLGGGGGSGAGGGSSGRRRSGEDGPPASGGGDSGRPISGEDLERRFERRVAPEAVPALLGSLLRALSLRAGGQGDLLTLFNHARGREGSWVHVPFAFDLDSIAFAGGFRVKLPYIGGGPGRVEARFRTSRQGEEDFRDWRLDLRFGTAEGARLQIDVNDAGVRESLLRRLGSLESELSALGCSVRVGRAESDAEAGGLDLDA